MLNFILSHYFLFYDLKNDFKYSNMYETVHLDFNNTESY